MLGHRTLIFICVIGIHTSYSSLEVIKTGWLDRVVSYLKESFVKDAASIAPIKLQTSITTAPPGYTDSPDWNELSVMRLLKLLSQSNPPKPVRRMMRQVLKDVGTQTRRMGIKQTYKLFPSMRYEITNDIYYDGESDSNEGSTMLPDPEVKLCNDTLLFIRNPLEARLPSGAISVALLRNIMYERALAARNLNFVTKKTTTHKFQTLFPKEDAASENKTEKNDNATTVDGASTPSANDTGVSANVTGNGTDSGNGTSGSPAGGEGTTVAAK